MHRGGAQWRHLIRLSMAARMLSATSRSYCVSPWCAAAESPSETGREVGLAPSGDDSGGVAGSKPLAASSALSLPAERGRWNPLDGCWSGAAAVAVSGPELAASRSGVLECSSSWASGAWPAVEGAAVGAA